MRRSLTLPERTALLLIDLQEEQRHDPLYKAFAIQAVLANAGRLLEEARRLRRPVIHAAYRRDFARRPPRSFEPVGADGGATFSDAASPLTRICPEVAPRAGETVIWKNDASAFCEGDLAPLLDAARTEWLVMSGVWTEACVAATVRDAMALGLRVLLVKDACGSGTRAMHETAVLNLANRLYGGAVADTDRAVALLAGETRPVWITERPVPILFDYESASACYDEL